jgi:DNA excision repair protein ERCC-8
VSSLQWYSNDNGLFFSGILIFKNFSGSFDCYLRVWDTNQLKTIYSFKYPEKIYSISVSLISNQTLIAGASDNNIRLCDVYSKGFSHILVGHREKIYSVLWSNTNPYQLFSASSDQTIR